MLTTARIGELLEPVSKSGPCGSDPEYDPAFMALLTDATGRAEQQFGETIIPAVEPDWSQIAERADAILQRSRDLRCAILLTRAATRIQGTAGTRLGLELIAGLLENFWGSVHPGLDADDDDDATMRLNALAALNDESALIRDLFEARLGNAAGIGPVRVRDVACAYGLLTPTDGTAPLSMIAIQGAMNEILASTPDLADDLLGLDGAIERVSRAVSDRTSGAETLDLERLHGVGRLLRQCLPQSAETASDAPAPPGAADARTTAPATAAIAGEIRTRQDALQTIDRVIRYLEQSEPGNPAPLLLARAKQLIGVSFLEIISNLAPNAMDTIEIITGRPPDSDQE